jgi:hypothetical protein
MFVREDLQPFGLAIPLLIEAIRLQALTKVIETVPKASFKVLGHLSGMVHFVRKSDGGVRGRSE